MVVLQVVYDLLVRVLEAGCQRYRLVRPRLSLLPNQLHETQERIVRMDAWEAATSRVQQDLQHRKQRMTTRTSA